MENKVVIVTGASKGIGAQIAKRFAKDGYKVLINYNKSENEALILANEIVQSGGTALTYKADVSNLLECEKMVEYCVKMFGHLDVLVNNAGVCSNKLLIDEDSSSINKVIGTNLIGTINMCKAAYPFLLKNGSGKVVNISSIWGVCGASLETLYSASKGGIIAFTKALAKELSYSNIQVNCVAPGVVETDMMKNFTVNELQELKEQIPLNRFANPSEIADVVAFLCSEQADYITGQTIQVDGGFMM